MTTDSAAPATEPTPPTPTIDSWEQLLDQLRRRYPGQKDSVLFCINKLHQNPELTLRDFRDEARLYGLTLAGRSLHSAKVLLGLAEPSPKPQRKPTQDAEPATTFEAGVAPTGQASPPRARKAATTAAASIEDQLLDVVQRLQSTKGAEAERLRDAIRAALAVIEDALADE